MVASNAGTTSSLEIVKEFLASIRGRAPQVDELRRIRPALEDLDARVQRLRKMYPACAAVGLSEEVQRLMWLAKQDNGRKDEDEGLWRSAASLL